MEDKRNSALPFIIVIIGFILFVGGLTVMHDASKTRQKIANIQLSTVDLIQRNQRLDNESQMLRKIMNDYQTEVAQRTDGFVKMLNDTDCTADFGNIKKQQADLKKRQELAHEYLSSAVDVNYTQLPTQPFTISYGSLKGSKLPVYISGGNPNRKVAHVSNQFGIELSYNVLTKKFSNVVVCAVENS